MKIKKIISCVFSVFIISQSAGAVYAGSLIGNYTYNNFTYDVNSNNTVSIISCDSDAVSVSVPDKIYGMPVVNIHSEAFSKCSSLESITVDQNNQYFTVCDGILFSMDRTKLIKCPQGLELESYYIPQGTVSVCPGAFAECEELEFLSVPESVSSIGSDAFADTGFTSITISGKTVSFGETPLGYNDGKAVENFTVYGKSGSTAETYAAANGLNFLPVDSTEYSVKINGNLYYYTEYKNFAGGNILVTDISGDPVSYAFSSSPEAVNKKYGTALTKIDILDTAGNIIASANVRTAVRGDANQDGKYNIRDAAAIARRLANRNTFTGFDKFCADANGDGKVNIRDAAAIARKLVSENSK